MRHLAICRSSGWYRPPAPSLGRVLDQHVLAGHAEVGAAVLHVGRHVGGAHEHDAHVGLVGRQDQLAGLPGSSVTTMPAAASSGSVSSKMRPLDSQRA
jgi:hypothetical protein